MRSRFLAVIPVGAAGLAASLALADQGPPPPKSTAGRNATVVARGVPTPTAFAFAGRQIFVSGYGDSGNSTVAGGVYVLEHGKALKLPGSPAQVFGLAYSRGTLYVSGSGRTGVGEIFAWSGWNGTRFTKRRAVVGSQRNFTIFNGLAVGPTGSLYAGVGLGASLSGTNDSSRGTTRYANDVVRVEPKSGTISVVATGMRQPWQLAFVPGHEGPLVTDLGQENLGEKRPFDYVVEAKQGANFGFPSCPAKPKSCAHYDKPFAVFPPHSSPMGIAPLGRKLYLTLFTGGAEGPEVVSMAAAGGKYAPVLVGFAAPVLALGARGRKIYVGDLTGTVYSFTP